MPRTKHLILIHGRSTKPSEKEKRRLVKKALLNGLGRVSTSARKKVEQGKVRFTFAFYGDINNRLMWADDPDEWRQWLTDRDPDHGNVRCEKSGSYNADLKTLLARDSSQFTKASYRKFLREVPDQSWKDDAALVLSGIASIFGLNDNIIRKATPDMAEYLQTREIGSAVRDRLQRPLKKALGAGEDVCLVAHSMGTIVSYDVLWKFSRMSEYAELRDKPVTKWITLGCPLGEPGVRGDLYDAGERENGMYPNVPGMDWVNFAAKDDFVSHDRDLADDFKDMRRRRLVKAIRDRRIYTFWAGEQGANPHKFYGYLDNPKVAGEIADWIVRPS